MFKNEIVIVLFSDYSLISLVFKPSNNAYSLRGIYNTQADFPKVGKNKLVLLRGTEGILVTTNSLLCFSI